MAAQQLVVAEADPLAPCLTALAALVVLLTAVGRALFELTDEWPVVFLFGLIVCGAVAATVVLLMREQRGFPRRA